jgi:hypothetical protein
MLVLGGWVFLVSEVPPYRGDRFNETSFEVPAAPPPARAGLHVTFQVRGRVVATSEPGF